MVIVINMMHHKQKYLDLEMKYISSVISFCIFSIGETLLRG